MLWEVGKDLTLLSPYIAQLTIATLLKRNVMNLSSVIWSNHSYVNVYTLFWGFFFLFLFTSRNLPSSFTPGEAAITEGEAKCMQDCLTNKQEIS